MKNQALACSVVSMLRNKGPLTLDDLSDLLVDEGWLRCTLWLVVRPYVRTTLQTTMSALKSRGLIVEENGMWRRVGLEVTL